MLRMLPGTPSKKAPRSRALVRSHGFGICNSLLSEASLPPSFAKLHAFGCHSSGKGMRCLTLANAFEGKQLMPS